MGAEDVFGIVGTTQAGAYQVEGVVAEGGFAVVYRAYHSAFRAQVALKCLKVPESLGAQHYQEFLERFREEGELLFRLSSSTPAVVRPLHVGILEGVSRFVPFIALEWLEGQTLDALIEARNQRFEPPLTLKEAVRLLTPVARALERAHHFPGAGGEVCILHRDMKPENVFVVELHGQRSAKILDFGIGKVKSVATQMVGHQSTQGDGIVAFTPAFGAPEQWLPKRFGQTGPWTDVWGLALTLLNAVTAGHRWRAIRRRCSARPSIRAGAPRPGPRAWTCRMPSSACARRRSRSILATGTRTSVSSGRICTAPPECRRAW